MERYFMGFLEIIFGVVVILVTLAATEDTLTRVLIGAGVGMVSIVASIGGVLRALR